MPALGVCSPQPCLSSGRMLTVSSSCLDYCLPIGLFLKREREKFIIRQPPIGEKVSKTTISMECLVNWILLRIRVRLKNTQHSRSRRLDNNTDGMTDFIVYGIWRKLKPKSASSNLPARICQLYRTEFVVLYLIIRCII